MHAMLQNPPSYLLHVLKTWDDLDQHIIDAEVSVSHAVLCVLK